MKKFLTALLFLGMSSHVFAGSFTDSRDGRTYNTKKIGQKTWMAENLKFKKGVYNSGEASTACPTGWHLPTVTEFEALLNTVAKKECPPVDSSDVRYEACVWKNALPALKKKLGMAPATYLAGGFDMEGNESYETKKGIVFWNGVGCSEEEDEDVCYWNILSFKGDNAVLEVCNNAWICMQSGQTYNAQVRCVKD